MSADESLNLRHMPGTVQSLIDELPEDIQAAVVIYRTPDGWYWGYSNMTEADLALAHLEILRRLLFGPDYA